MTNEKNLWWCISFTFPSTYDQNEFFDDSANDNGLDNEGYVFIPDRLGKNLYKTIICKS